MPALEDKIKGAFSYMQREWVGQECVEEMRDTSYPHWRQMEWIGFYFQMQCERLLSGFFEIPGDSYRDGSVKFDGKCDGINFDFKAHSSFKANGKPEYNTILNDTYSMEESVKSNGIHRLILAELRCTYDKDGAFRQWHDSLKGKKSKYVQEGEAIGRSRRMRKVAAKVEKIFILTVTRDNLPHLLLHKQGKNSDGAPRRLKYKLNTRDIRLFSPFEIQFREG